MVDHLCKRSGKLASSRFSDTSMAPGLQGLKYTFIHQNALNKIY